MIFVVNHPHYETEGLFDDSDRNHQCSVWKGEEMLFLTESRNDDGKFALREAVEKAEALSRAFGGLYTITSTTVDPDSWLEVQANPPVSTDWLENACSQDPTTLEKDKLHSALLELRRYRNG